MQNLINQQVFEEMERHETETMQDYAEKIKYLYDYIENKELKIN